MSAKSRLISSLTKINEYLKAPSEELHGDTLDQIEVELVNLRSVDTPPQVDPGVPALKSRLPSYLRKRLRATIKKNEEMIATLKEWEIK